jgi:hypothetical protein
MHFSGGMCSERSCLSKANAGFIALPDKMRDFYDMTQKRRPSSKRKRSSSKSHSASTTNDLVTRMSELRRLRTQVKKMEAELFSNKGSARTVRREARPSEPPLSAT